MTAPLAARDAARQILSAIRRQPPLRVPLDDALGAVLAEPVTSPLDIPPWNNAAMDGYAVRATDVRGASGDRPARLTVIEAIPAGGFPTLPVGAGQATRIFTGAPVPEGADTVIRQEDTDLGAATVAISNDRDAGTNVRRAGDDIRNGMEVFAEGVELGPAQLGLLASMAVSHPMVYRRPRVAILSTGDELVDVDQPDEILAGRKLASSNSHTLQALVRQAGAEPVALGIARDTPESLRAHLARAAEADLLVTSAGISVGDHDHVRAVLSELGTELKFWRLRMRPGAPVGFGLLGPLPWIGLPGNPVSSMVTFELFVRPAIRAMAGRRLPFRRSIAVRTAEPIRVVPRLQHFQRAIVTPAAPGAVPEARLTGPQGSGILSSMARANALLILPEGQLETPAGAELQAILLDDPVHQAEPAF